jgi:hypothetical protein
MPEFVSVGDKSSYHSLTWSKELIAPTHQAIRLEPIWKINGIASACSDMDELGNKLQGLYGKKAGFQFQLTLVASRDGTIALR